VAGVAGRDRDASGTINAAYQVGATGILSQSLTRAIEDRLALAPDDFTTPRR